MKNEISKYSNSIIGKEKASKLNIELAGKEVKAAIEKEKNAENIERLCKYLLSLINIANQTTDVMVANKCVALFKEYDSFLSENSIDEHKLNELHDIVLLLEHPNVKQGGLKIEQKVKTISHSAATAQ